MHDSGLCVARLAEMTGRLTSVYRAMPESRLLRSLPDGRTGARAGYDLAALLARMAHGVEERESAVEPKWRDFPDVGPFSVGDQIAVAAHELVAVVTDLVDMEGPDELVWSGDPGKVGQRVPAAVSTAAALDAAADLWVLIR
ncbi:MAG TPA: hypothetical protein VGM10_34425 [Actinocrinis sp.]|jgi:hypothetical protein